MAKLIYVATTSLDGYVEDKEGKIDWGAPSEEVSVFINDLVRPIGTYLFGRRMYETMVSWETFEAVPDQPGSDFAAVWHSADKVVYSKTLDVVSSARTRIERDFDAQAISTLKSTSDHDICVGGAELAGQAIAAGLVDELRLFVLPLVLGGGKRALPNDVRLNLQLLDERRFNCGRVYLRYGLGA
ncbi:MAG TPA: dihydrofolate reductase family protein [Candidatus Tumulicola sp.]|jgi:dihydrofolate reductase